jgi:uncharacterized protein YhhL (DUF1145 family)
MNVLLPGNRMIFLTVLINLVCQPDVTMNNYYNVDVIQYHTLLVHGVPFQLYMASTKSKKNSSLPITMLK